MRHLSYFFFNDTATTFFFNDTATTEIYTLSLHDALPISQKCGHRGDSGSTEGCTFERSEEHTSELQSLRHLVCRLLLEKKKTNLLLSLAPSRGSLVDSAICAPTTV